jgi:hypothetical protein
MNKEKEFFGITFIDETPIKKYGDIIISIWDRKGSERGTNKGDLEAIINDSKELCAKCNIVYGNTLMEMCKLFKKKNISKISIYRRNIIEFGAKEYKNK